MATGERDRMIFSYLGHFDYQATIGSEMTVMREKCDAIYFGNSAAIRDPMFG